MGCCGKMSKGARGIFTAVAGLDPVPSSVKIDRLETCRPCEHRSLAMCTRCGCFIQAKIRVASESCPDGRWSPHP